MKALILNSGIGKRMGVLTSTHPKCMTKISDKETILSRQLRLLVEEGITEVVMTTGLFDGILEEYCQSLNLPLNITFVKNPIYRTTNYIYSIYCARKYLEDDIILMHGDLVFEKEILQTMISGTVSCMAVSSTTELPQKDFKAVIKNGHIVKIGIEFFDEVMAAQPLYRINFADWKIWMEQITIFCENNQVSCYAEKAFNEISDRCIIYPFDVKNLLCSEIDNPEDLAEISVRLRNMNAAVKNTKQKVLYADQEYKVLDKYFSEHEIKSILLVCTKAFPYLKISAYFDTLEKRLGIKTIKFSDFQPNPLYESVVLGIDLFRQKKCDAVVVVGGGSAIDVAKCIKLYSNINTEKNYLEEEVVTNNIEFLAIPTTAGPGSEATKYAVIYYEGEKQTISDESCIPSHVLMDSSTLDTLPLYQRKAGMLDALCHALESFWSIHSTEQSKSYSKEAIRLIFANQDLFLENDKIGNKNMQKAANIAGQAINITQTTAGHAMCYKLTSLYGIAHGHAAALCIAKLWPYMLANTDKCRDSRGRLYLDTVFEDIAKAMGCDSAKQAVDVFEKLLEKLQIESPQPVNEHDMEILRKSVNPVRLKNNPISLDEKAIDELYYQILYKEQKEETKIEYT